MLGVPVFQKRCECGAVVGNKEEGRYKVLEGLYLPCLFEFTIATFLLFYAIYHHVQSSSPSSEWRARSILWP
jgi:hypothetical protein